MLNPDGTFEVRLPPGRNNLDLLLLGTSEGAQRTIAVEREVVIQESQLHVVARP